MSFVNFRVPGAAGTLYSVDFKVYSDEHRIANSGYHMLDPTEEALAESANTFTDAEAWRTANAKIFTDLEAAKTSTDGDGA